MLGFRVNMRPDDPLAPAMRSFCDVFGGGPYSKLFMNVREKMSLCYYCSARFARQNSYIFIQCGCEEENMDKAVAEILHQLEMIRDGDCKAELESSRIAMMTRWTAWQTPPTAWKTGMPPGCWTTYSVPLPRWRRRPGA